MKLSDHTVEIINNFKILNPGLVVKKGNTIKTVSSKGSMPIAIAKLKESFPVDFAIADLHRFLTVFNLLDDPELDFRESDVVLTDTNRSATIRYAAPSMVKHMDYSWKIQMPSEDVKFKLKASDFKSIKKAADYFISPEIAIIGDGKNITISTYNSDDKSSDKFSVDLGIPTSHNFIIILQTEYLSVLQRDYDITISFKGLLEFKSVGENSEVCYYIAASEKSKVY